jgi:hypothetical protein
MTNGLRPSFVVPVEELVPAEPLLMQAIHNR